jgi:adenylate kinase family enzyme
MTQDRDFNREYLRAQYQLCNMLAGELLAEESHSRQGPAIEMPHKDPPGGNLDCQSEQVAAVRQRIDAIVTAAQASGHSIPFDDTATSNELDSDERIILMVLFFSRFNDRSIKGIQLLDVVTGPGENRLSRAHLLTPAGRLIKSGLVEWRRHSCQMNMVFEREFRISATAIWAISGIEDGAKLDSTEVEKKEPASRNLDIRKPRVSFDQLVLDPEIVRRIDDAIWLAGNAERVYRDYGLGSSIAYGRAVTMLFYGAPGTGKTATAEAIAHKLGKDIAVARYSQIVDMFFGESEKNLTEAFRVAREADCVLLFDEADTLFSRRLTEVRPSDRHYNNLVNILMQEIENHEGVVILTTNRQTAIDEAFERRLLLKLEFPEPGPKARAAIWRSLLSRCPRLADDVDFEELGRRLPMSGGKIKNAVQCAVAEAARKDAAVTMSILERPGTQNESGSGCCRRRIGF